ncbi:trigger factor [Prevotella intermedia]|uniref:Trigger factor n=1 Tax=Prevotella intermedia TaxID=28131 RepID=A0AAJ3RTD5_PREIN|nr:trigger factor [Prevotella intermedia]ATV55056.1 trigger factor [Prevotella intermedia]PJI19973.1 trigger factor [Prevotella intermedia]
MKISFENPDKLNGLLTIVVEEADYKEEVEKALKDYRKRANIPGFRPGQVPMGLLKRQVGPQVKMDAINKILGENLQKYIVDNKIHMLGQPMASETQEAVELEKPAPYTFKFDIAVAPEFNIELTNKDTIDYYEIKVDDKLIDQQVEMFANRAGHYDKAEEFEPEKRDMLKGDIRELDANGNTLEGGITVEGAVMMPQYIKVDDQKKLFDGSKLGDIITFNPRKAYPEGDAEIASLLKIDRKEVENHTGDFSYQITEISRFVNAENNKELWDSVYGAEANINDEAVFRAAIAEGISKQLERDSDYKFMQDLRAYADKKVGDLQFPDALLKRVMLANNEDKGAEFVEKNYEPSIKELKWHLVRDQIAKANNIQVEDADIRESAAQMARAQFAQYGMNNVPDEYVNNYVEEMMKKRENIDSFIEAALDRKLSVALKSVVKLKKKSVSLDEFNKLMMPAEEAAAEKPAKAKRTKKADKAEEEEK